MHDPDMSENRISLKICNFSQGNC